MRSSLLALLVMLLAASPALALGPVVDLNCDPIGSGPTVVAVWDNDGPYTHIEVCIDGLLFTTLPGGHDSVTATLPSPHFGAHEICIKPFDGTTALPEECCSFVFSSPTAPTGVSCSAAGSTVTVSWMNAAPYGSIRILMDGIVELTLPGSASTATLTGVAPGSHFIIVRAFAGGSPAGAAACSVVVAPEFVRGDCNDDGLVNLADSIFSLTVMFPASFPVPTRVCEDACDLNDDGVINIADAVFGLVMLFGGGATPAPPYPGCGVDPTADSLGCSPTTACP